MIKIIGRLYPKKVREECRNLFFYCGIKKDVESYLANVFIISIAAAILFGFLVKLLIDLPVILIILAVFVVIQGSIYTWLNLTADSKSKYVESILPDVLQLMSSNLRAGLTIDRALLYSARPEFGEFSEDIVTVGKEVATGKEFNKSLISLSKKFKSDTLRKTVQVINSGINSGGELADLLEHTAVNLRQQKLVEERIRANVLVYVIFIFSAIGFGAPMLFGLSSFLIQTITDITSQIQIPETTGSLNIPLTFSQVSVSPKFVKNYTLISLTVTSILGSMIIGLISKGKEKEGFKYMPILLALTLSLFFLVRFAVASILGGLFNL